MTKQAQAEDRRAQIQADLRRVANTTWLPYEDRTMLLAAAAELSRLSRVEQVLRAALTAYDEIYKRSRNAAEAATAGALLAGAVEAALSAKEGI